MSAKLLLAIFAVVLTTAMAGRQSRGSQLGDYYYYLETLDDTTGKTQASAIKKCQDGEGHLAKMISYSIFTILLRDKDFPQGHKYWIDGSAGGALREDFKPEECPNEPHLVDFPDTSLELGSAKTCLIAEKGATTSDNKIKSTACNADAQGVICAIRYTGQCT